MFYELFYELFKLLARALQCTHSILLNKSTILNNHTLVELEETTSTSTSTHPHHHALYVSSKSSAMKQSWRSLISFRSCLVSFICMWTSIFNSPFGMFMQDVDEELMWLFCILGEIYRCSSTPISIVVLVVILIRRIYISFDSLKHFSSRICLEYSSKRILKLHLSYLD